MGEGLLSKAIDNIFEMKKSSFYLILIFILGFILRLIGAINLGVAADDMHFVTHAINFLSAGKLITWGMSSGLWHAFISVMYNIFGTTQLSSRMAALLFGSFSIPLIYSLSKEFFNEKISLLSAFLLAISPFLLKNMTADQDAMAMFFVLLSMFLFIRALKNNKTQYYVLSGLSIGLAIYTKVYPLLFIPSLILYFIYFKRKEKKKIFSKENCKKIFIFLLMAFIFCLPALTHNYLLYKDKGFLDLQFTRSLGLGKNISEQYYGWDYQFNAKNDWKGLILGNSFHRDGKGPPLLWEAIADVFLFTPVILSLGFLGIALILVYRKEHRDYLMFYLSGILFVLPFLASIILLTKHYLFLEILIFPIAALFINEIANKLSRLIKINWTKLLLIFLLFSSLIILGLNEGVEPFYSKSHVAQMIDFKDSNIPKGALIVMDSRMYRGRVNWVSQGRPYLEGVEFLSLMNQQDTLPGNKITADVYYFECIPDDCGWGTVKNQPDFNSSMESLTDFFKQNGNLLKTISEPEEKPYYPILAGSKIPLINIYSAKIQTKDSVITLANKPKNWFLYTVGYFPVEENFDYYEVHNPIDNALNKIAHIVVYVALILAFLSIIYIIYLLKPLKSPINQCPQSA